MMAVLAGLWSAHMLVQAPAEGLRWQAPAGCPDAARVTGTIERRLGRALAVGEARVEATVVRVGREFRLSLRLGVGARSEAREVVDESCEALAEVVALRVAAAVEGPATVPAPPVGRGSGEAQRGSEVGRAGRERGSEAAGRAGAGGERGGELGSDAAAGEAVGRAEVGRAEVGRGSDVVGRAQMGRGSEAVGRAQMGRGSAVVGRAGEASGVVEAEEPGVGFLGVEKLAGAGAARRSLRPGGVLRVQGGGEFGLLPGVTGAVGLAGGLLWKRVRVELQGLFFAPRTVTREGVSLRAAMVAGSLHVCARRGRGKLEAPLCGGVELGAMRGVASGVAGARAATGLLVAAMVGQGLVWHVNRRVSVWSSLQLVVAPRVPRFELSNAVASQKLFAPSPISGRLLAGVELRLGDPW